MLSCNVNYKNWEESGEDGIGKKCELVVTGGETFSLLSTVAPLGSECPSGTYYNNQISRLINDTSTWDTERCVSCPNGTYSSEDIFTIDECLPCAPGTYQPQFGSSTCLDCPLGSFQPDIGKNNCDLCSKGGYCNSAQKGDGGFTACPPGTFNDKLGQSDVTACIECPPGRYSTENGADSESACLPCPSGRSNNKSGELCFEINNIAV